MSPTETIMWAIGTLKVRLCSDREVQGLNELRDVLGDMHKEITTLKLRVAHLESEAKSKYTPVALELELPEYAEVRYIPPGTRQIVTVVVGTIYSAAPVHDGYVLLSKISGNVLGTILCVTSGGKLIYEAT
jgi:hypothetical protein